MYLTSPPEIDRVGSRLLRNSTKTTTKRNLNSVIDKALVPIIQTKAEPFGEIVRKVSTELYPELWGVYRVSTCILKYGGPGNSFPIAGRNGLGFTKNIAE